MTCNKILQAQGKAYPRTCAACGLGPCSQAVVMAKHRPLDEAQENMVQTWGAIPDMEPEALAGLVKAALADSQFFHGYGPIVAELIMRRVTIR